ncbi:MAG: hypothetical protein F6K28_49365 [Microcoleus sp. SIO2G3]|nr:hypothetical protein [Microcoleus sp. SIO2G3]
MTDPKPSTKSVTLNLPIDVIAAIIRLSRELEQPQSEVLVNALRRGLAFLEAEPAPSVDLAQLVDRVAALESLPAQVAGLAAEVDRLRQDSQKPPAELSVDLPVAPAAIIPSQAEHCPRCNHPLNAPLKSSGRQVCIKCGWTNKPRTPDATTEDLPPDQLQRLLDRAAAEAIANMKPKKSAPEPKKFPFGGRP